MQTNILQKCVDELGKESPKLDYVRGMLETLIEIEKPIVDQVLFNKNMAIANTLVPTKDPEVAFLESKVPQDIQNMKKFITTEWLSFSLNSLSSN